MWRFMLMLSLMFLLPTRPAFAVGTWATVETHALSAIHDMVSFSVRTPARGLADDFSLGLYDWGDRSQTRALFGDGQKIERVWQADLPEVFGLYLRDERTGAVAYEPLFGWGRRHRHAFVFRLGPGPSRKLLVRVWGVKLSVVKRMGVPIPEPSVPSLAAFAGLALALRLRAPGTGRRADRSG